MRFIKTLDEARQLVLNKSQKIGGNTFINEDCGGWLNCYNKHFVAYHYCGAIFKHDLDKYMDGGFCEQYANGLCYDDDDFVKHLIYNEFKLLINEFDKNMPFVIHQYHDKYMIIEEALFKEKHEINKAVFDERCSNINFKNTVDIHASPINESPMHRQVLLDNDKQWLLKKIPKTLYVYWGGNMIPFLRYLTIITFNLFNPDWDIVLFLPVKISPICVWNEKQFEQKTTKYINYIDCMFELQKINKITIEYFDFEEIGLSNDLNEVHKSDYLRYYLLYTRGGVWSDMDILYYQSINNLSINNDENITKECFIKCRDDDSQEIGIEGHAIGFLMGSMGNAFFKELFELAKNQYKPNVYQGVGPDLLNEFYAMTPNTIEKFNIGRITKSDIYCLDHDTKSLFTLYDKSNIFNNSFINKSVGIHWYGGHSDFKHVLLDFNHLNINNYPNLGFAITKIREINRTMKIFTTGYNAVGTDLTITDEPIKHKISLIIISTNLSRRFYTLVNTIESFLKFKNIIIDEIIVSIDMIYDKGNTMTKEQISKFFIENGISSQIIYIFKEGTGMLSNQLFAIEKSTGDIIIYSEDDIIVNKLPSRQNIIELTSNGVITYNKHLSYSCMSNDLVADNFVHINDEYFYLKDKNGFDKSFSNYATGENLSVLFPLAIMRQCVFNDVYNKIHKLDYPFCIEAAFSHVINTSDMKSYIFCDNNNIPLDVPWLYRDNSNEIAVAGETIDRNMSKLSLLTRFDIDMYNIRKNNMYRENINTQLNCKDILHYTNYLENKYLIYNKNMAHKFLNIGLFDLFNNHMTSDAAIFIARIGGSDFNFVRSYMSDKTVTELNILKEYNGYFDNSTDDNEKTLNVKKFVDWYINSLSGSHFYSFVEFNDIFLSKNLYNINSHEWDKVLSICSKCDTIFDYNSSICNPNFFIRSMYNWGRNKKILVISPFSETVQYQYQHRKNLHNENLLMPDFTLLTYTTPITYNKQSQVNYKTSNNWFEACDIMFNEIQNIDFDIALLSCGSYSNELGFRICDIMKKKAIYVGGALNLIFNIYGTRYTSDMWNPMQKKYLNLNAQVNAIKTKNITDINVAYGIKYEGMNAYI